MFRIKWQISDQFSGRHLIRASTSLSDLESDQHKEWNGKFVYFTSDVQNQQYKPVQGMKWQIYDHFRGKKRDSKSPVQGMKWQIYDHQFREGERGIQNHRHKEWNEMANLWSIQREEREANPSRMNMSVTLKPKRFIRFGMRSSAVMREWGCRTQLFSHPVCQQRWWLVILQSWCEDFSSKDAQHEWTHLKSCKLLCITIDAIPQKW